MSVARTGVVKPAVARLPDREAKRAKDEWPFEVGLVPLINLEVDDTYQRPPHHEFISREATRFDPTLVGTIDVSERTGRHYAILDGQQRYLMMLQVGKTACYCSIYKNMTVPDEAGFFYRKNKDRMAMKPYFSFRARRVAGDSDAEDIARIVEGEGFSLGPQSNSDDVIGAVRAIETAYQTTSEHREQCLANTLYTIREAFQGRKDCFNSTVIVGVSKFWQAYTDDEVNFEKLVQSLQEMGPTGLLGLARDSVAVAPKGATGAQSMPKHVARHVARLHNKALPGGARSKGRLDVKRVGF